MECSICIEIYSNLSYKRLKLSLRASRQFRVVRIEKIEFLTFSEWLCLYGLHVDESFTTRRSGGDAYFHLLPL